MDDEFQFRGPIIVQKRVGNHFKIQERGKLGYRVSIRVTPQVYWAIALILSYFRSSSCCQGRGEEIPEGGVLMSTFPFFFTVPTDDETPFVYPLPILVLGPIRLLAFLGATKPAIREIFD